MKVLVLGGGGREHALAWKLSREPSVSDVYCAPGNPGSAACAINLPVDLRAPEAVVALVQARGIDLTVIGPEQPLEAGVADALRDAGLAVFGPSRAAARLETSKAFAKAFMERHGVPTGRARVCTSPVEAEAAIEEFGAPVVIKADGLAAGKGVTVAATVEQARAAVDAAMRQDLFGDAGRTLLVEECLTGPEVSFFVLCDGRRALPLATAQDHKRAYDGDLGPNTGGMGAFAPSPLFTLEMAARVMGEIIEPVIRGMRAEGNPYHGFLYAGLMLTAGGPKVIEFNVRFGDPEAQVVLPALAGPFAGVLLAAAKGTLRDAPALEWNGEIFAGVVLASGGYPASFESGREISGLDAGKGDALLFHAGTARKDGGFVTAGGRVLTVVGRGPAYRAAIDRAYYAVSQITFDKMHFRTDIGRSAL